MIERFKLYLEEQEVHLEYESKLNEVEEKFMQRIQELAKSIEWIELIDLWTFLYA